MNSEEFWNRVKALIKEQNSKQQTVATKVGVSLGVFQGWIHNKRYPDALQVYKLAQALNTTVEYLVTGIESPNKKTIDSIQLFLSEIEGQVMLLK